MTIVTDIHEDNQAGEETTQKNANWDDVENGQKWLIPRFSGGIVEDASCCYGKL